MSSFVDLQEVAKTLALKAIDLDQNGQIESAIFYYLEASQALIDFKQNYSNRSYDSSANFNMSHLTDAQSNQINSKLNEYLSRAEVLKKQLLNKSSPQNKSKNSHIKSEFQVFFNNYSHFILNMLNALFIISERN